MYSYNQQCALKLLGADNEDDEYGEVEQEQEERDGLPPEVNKGEALRQLLIQQQTEKVNRSRALQMKRSLINRQSRGKQCPTGMSGMNQ